MIYPFVNPVYTLIHIPAGSGQVDHLYQELTGDTFHIYREMIILIIVHNGVIGQIDIAAFFSVGVYDFSDYWLYCLKMSKGWKVP